MNVSERRKGLNAERDFAKKIGGKRVPLSGAAGGEYTGDVKALGLRWQCKVRHGGFKLVYDSLKGHDALAIKQDYHDWLVVMPVETLLNMLPAESVPAWVEIGMTREEFETSLPKPADIGGIVKERG